jgi:DNA-binding MarR family transcriptional regulator
MTADDRSSRTPTGLTLQFMQQLWGLTHELQVASKRMARTLGVTGPQRLVVRLVGQSPGINARELALTLGIHPSTLTGVLARLERQRLVTRSIDPSDRRRARFRLTAAGTRIDAERRGTVEAAVRRALGRADPTVVAKSRQMIQLIVEELTKDAPAHSTGSRR